MRICIVEGCYNKKKSRDYCAMHYTRLKRDGTPGEPGKRRMGPKPKPRPECVIVGCDNPQANLKHGWCESHRNKNKKLLERFGITLTEYNRMWEEQNRQCKICGRENGTFGVDHCHDTGIVRGILCHHCNTALGNFNDDSILLEKAILYLKGVL